MNNPNDRYNLVLLRYKARKGLNDKRKMRKLSKQYPDNAVYESKIIDLFVLSKATLHLPIQK